MELCMDTGWSIEYVLHMPAIRFFAIKKAHTRVGDERLGKYFYEMCDVFALAPQSNESLQALKVYYKNWFDDERIITKRQNPRSFDSTNAKDREQVASILQGFARYMR